MNPKKKPYERSVNRLELRKDRTVKVLDNIELPMYIDLHLTSMRMFPISP